MGTTLLGPWQMQMVELSVQLENSPIPGDLYDLIRLPFTVTGLLQVLLLTIIVAVSVRKPWGKRISRQK